MRIRFALLVIATLAATAAARATPVTYSIKGYINTDPTQAITVTGMTTLDICASYPCSPAVNPSVLSIFLNFANGTSQTGIGTLGQDYGHTVYVGGANDRFSFTDDLHNYTLAGGTFNLQDVSGNYVGAVFNGTLTAVTVTPEPSSIALVGTGLLGVAGVLRRRFAQA